MCTYLNSVLRGVEEANAADAGKDRVSAVLEHVMGAHRGQTLSLCGKDSPLHHGEIFLIQHLRHFWQLPPKRE